MGSMRVVDILMHPSDFSFWPDSKASLYFLVQNGDTFT